MGFMSIRPRSIWVGPATCSASYARATGMSSHRVVYWGVSLTCRISQSLPLWVPPVEVFVHGPVDPAVQLDLSAQRGLV